MSKEEDFLKLVLNKFSNIREVLNGTKDVENFLHKAKLCDSRDYGEILERTKHLVENLLYQSTCLKDEFYTQYNDLNKVPTTKEIRERNNTMEEANGLITKSLKEKSTAMESSTEVFNKNTDLVILVSKKTCQNSTGNCTNEKRDLNLLEEDRTTCVSDKHNDSGAKELVEKKTTLESTEDGLNSVDINESKTIADVNDDINNITTEKTHDSNHTDEDPLKDMDTTDIIESSMLNNSDQSLTNNDNVISTGSGDKNGETVDESVERKSLIRLVDLSKLIDPKPKKSVKFDSSVIILTSSDDESPVTPQKKNDKSDHSVLKSALKNSFSNVLSDDRKNKVKRIEGNSSDCGIQEDKKKSGRSKELEKEKSGGEENKVLNPFRKRTRCDRKSRYKNGDKDKENSKEERSKEKYKYSKNTDDSKNDLDSNSEDESLNPYINQQIGSSEEKQCISNLPDSGNLKNKMSKELNLEISMEDEGNEETSYSNSRRSSRICKIETNSLKRKETLKKLLKGNKSETSVTNFETIKNNADKTRNKKNPNNMSNKHNLSGTPNSSDSESSNLRKLKFKETGNKLSGTASSMVIDDEKFSYELYIPLPLIKCEKIKDMYLKNKSILEVKSVPNVKSVRSAKRSHPIKSNAKSSSDSENSKIKRSKKSPLKENIELDEACGPDGIDNTTLKMHAEQEEQRIILDKISGVGTEGHNKGSQSDSDKSEENQKNSEKEQQDDRDKEKIKHDSSDEDKRSSNKSTKVNSSDSETCSENSRKKEKKKSDKESLPSADSGSSDSEEDFSKFSKRRDKSRTNLLRRAKKKIKKAIVISSESDYSDDNKKSKNETHDSNCSEENSSESNSDKDEDQNEKKPTRRRIRRTKDSSSSEEDRSTRKKIRGVLGKDSLSETTKQAEAEEKERKLRIAEKQKKYNKIFETKADSKLEKVVLDFDEKLNKELLSVHKDLVKKLKPHQASGVQFMWDASFESLERASSTKGSGCILAHCMGLGKTLQVIALVHTLLAKSSKTNVTKVMVVCPINTVLNWKAEFKKWLPKKDRFEVYELVSCKQNYERQHYVSEWHTDGGVLIIGYTMFRNLSNPDNKRISKKMRTVFHEGLVDPGPDLVVCDEGHLLKNEKTHLSIAMNRIKTARRIVLTGTPLQNNLKEYWCMVQFIKPNLLGTYKEYLNRFVNPIINGQYTDSTQHDILLMRKRSHVLHKLLDGVVQRRDYSVLEPYLPPKYEYVLFVSLTETQVKLYKHYMEKFARQNDGSNRTSFLFTDFQQLQRICTHPRVLLDKSHEDKKKDFLEEESEGSLKDFIDDGDANSSSESSESSSNSGSSSDCSGSGKNDKKKNNKQKTRLTRAQAAERQEKNEDDSDVEEVEKKEWFQEYCDGDELDNINNSGKLFLLFQILKECEEIGDKVLVFSQSLYTLNCIEYFLEKIDEATQNNNAEKVHGHTGSWAIGLDYFRLDGSSSCDNRATWCDMFNNPDNIRARLFLISTKAGGLGINLVAANRVIIFDVSWNPSHDIQSIYRVYRFGQTKPCYIYRFVTYGTMEMKIYERQVTKQAISKRVIDEQQIDRHYNQNDLQELYKCDLEPTDRPIPMVPKDVLLGEMLQKYDKTIYKYHLHQSLLENKEDEGLNEDERKAAWEEFENEKVLRKNTSNMGMGGFGFNNAHSIAAALTNIVKKDNPTWSDVQIRGIIPALVQQLQVQLSEGDMSMYSRVQQEIQIMQALQAQKMKEAYYQQQVMRMIQQQQQQAALMGNMNVDPAQIARTQAAIFNNLLAGGPRRAVPGFLDQQRQGPSTAKPRQMMSNDIIELND